MSIPPGADRVDLIAAINDGHLPSPGPVTQLVKIAYDRFKTDDSGPVADYIPALAAMPRDRFGICVVGVDGASLAPGDTAEAKWQFIQEHLSRFAGRPHP